MVKPSFRAACFALAACMAPAGAAVLSFDNLPIAGGPFLAPYDGFTFGTNNAATTAWHYSSSPAGIYYGPYSGSGYATVDPALYQGGLLEEGQPISRQDPFIFQGAWVTGINQIRFLLYNGDQFVYQSQDSPELGWKVPMFVPSGYDGLVTRVVIAGPQGYFAIDDFTYQLPVPEPSMVHLFALGALSLALRRRRR